MKSPLLFILIWFSHSVFSQNTVETYSGSSAGLLNGDRLTAKYNNLAGLAQDKWGNLYLADVDNHCIRKIDTNGQVTTFAGAGIAGFQDGAASTARFNQPWGLCIDDSMNVYVSDFLNQRIRKIAHNGMVSTIAGTAFAGFKEGNGDTAQFNYPRGICLDNKGFLYIADSWNHRIRKIANGLVSTFAGNGVNKGVQSVGALKDTINALAEFYTPTGIVFDGLNFYVADAYNHAIRKIQNGTSVMTIAGGIASGPNSGDFDDGLPGTSKLNTVTELYYYKDSNYIVFSDLYNHCIRKINLNNNYTSTISGTTDTGSIDGKVNVAKFNRPRGIVQNKKGIFVNDGAGRTVRRLYTKSTASNITNSKSVFNIKEVGRQLSIESEELISKIVVYDLQGNILINQAGFKSQIQLDKTELNNGVYLICVELVNGFYHVEKIQVNKD